MGLGNKRITVRELKGMLDSVPDDLELVVNVINSSGKRRGAAISRVSLLTANRPHTVEIDVAP